MKNIICSLLLLLTVGYALAQTGSTYLTREFTPAELNADLDSLFHHLEATHPDLYAHMSPSVMANQQQAVRQALTRPMTRLSFSRLVAPLVTQFRDGHTSFALPQEERDAYFKQGGQLFPFQVVVQPSGVFVEKDYGRSSSDLVGAQLLSINGIPISDLVKTMKTYCSGETDSFVQINVAQSFRRLLWYVYGMTDTFAITVKRTGGPEQTVTIKGISLADFEATTKPTPGLAPQTNYSLSFINDNKTALLNLRSLANPGVFAQFLDSCFRELKTRECRDLIIDIRKNSGGDSQLGDELLRYLTRKPVAQYQRVELKLSPNVMKANWYPKLVQSDGFRRNRRGDWVVWEQAPKVPKALSDPGLFFAGNTYLLTSNYTFSSANALAAAVKCYQVATTIGEETGGVTVAFGELIGFRLPNTRLQAYVSCKRFVHPCAVNEKRGILPDIAVSQTLSDTGKGIDTVLQYTLNYINEQSTKTPKNAGK